MSLISPEIAKELAAIVAKIDIKTIATVGGGYVASKVTDGVVGDRVKDTAVQAAQQIQTDLERILEAISIGKMLGSENAPKQENFDFFLPDHMG